MFRGWTILLCLIVVPSFLLAQHTDTYWKYYDREDGLAGSWIRCLAEDSYGYLWIGTQSGLSRFDGTHFQNYYHQDDDSTSLISNYINSVYILPDNNILIGTIRGFSVFNPQSQTCQNHYLSFEKADSTTLNNIYSFQYWPDHTIWIATYAGVVEWSVDENEFKLLDPSFNVSRTGIGSPFLPHPTENGCWINMSDRWVYYDRATQSIADLPTGIPGKTYPRNDRVFETRSLDSKGRIWYGTYADSSLFCFDPATHTEKRFPFLLRTGDKTRQNSAIQILCDATGRVWVSSWSEFLQRLDENTGQFHREHIRNNDRLLMPEVSVYAMLQTRAGDLIFGTFEGLVVHTRSMDSSTRLDLPRSETKGNPNQYHILSQINYPGSSDHFAGTWGAGLFWYHAEIASFTQHKIPGEEYGKGVINDMLWWNGKLICATQMGVYAFDPGTRKFSANPFQIEVLDHAAIICMAKADNDIWFSRNNGKLYRLNLPSGEVKEFEHDEKLKSSIPNYYATFLKPDNLGGLWYAYHGGIGKLDLRSGEYQDYTPFQEKYFNGNTNVAGLLLDNSGTLWYSTSLVGLYRLVLGAEKFERIDVPAELGTTCPIPLAQDAAGDIWFYTESGLCYRNADSNEFISYSVEPNPASGMHFMTGITCGDNVIVLGGNTGLLSVDTDLKPARIPLLPPLISAIGTGDTNFPIGASSVNLSSDQNLFTIFFSTPSEIGRSGLAYEVIIEPLWNEWVSVQGRTSTTFNDLPGGSYTFRVRVKDATGSWVESLPLSIEVEKKFSETRGFRALLAMIFASLIFVAFTYYRRRTRKKLFQSVIERFISEKQPATPDQLAMEMVRICSDVYRVHTVVMCTSGAKGLPVELLAKSHDCAANDAHRVIETIMSSAVNTTGIPDLKGFTFYPVVHQGTTLAFIACLSDNRGDDIQIPALCVAGASRLAASLAQKEILEKEKMLAEVRNLLSESQLVSLRAQMNPHFVFNCLNSIQESILLKHYAEASLYLNKFSKLFRQVLQNSSRSLITLEEEMEVLTLYLELEHMRFQKSFDFTIECDPELDTEEVMIPSMLLQPFVENALWHGLMHKEGDRNLAIRFYPLNDEIFIAEVDDNGIGREKAMAIRKAKAIPGAHQSKGIAISTERLRLIHMEQDQHATVEIIDKKGPDGESLGTRVVFELSLYLN